MSAAQQPIGFILRLETEHFEFEAHGSTEKEATETMRKMLHKHGRLCGLPRNWSNFYADSFKMSQFIPNAGFLDNSRMI